MNIEIIAEIWATARRNKLRTALTGFAVAWGIFMIIFLLGAGNGLINAMRQNSDRFLATSMVVFGGTTEKPFAGLKEGRYIQLDDRDLAATASEEFAANVDEVGAMVTQEAQNISKGDNYVSASLSGVYPNDAEVNKREMLYGRFVNDLDMAQRRKVIVLSEDQAKELAPRDIGSLVGKYVDVGDFAFRVVGIYDTDDSELNNAAYSALTTVRSMFGGGDKVQRIVFTFHGLPDEASNKAFEKRYQARINRNHQAAPDDNNATWIWNRFTQNLQMNTGVGIIHIALWVIGLFTLLSGIVGVSNIMLITVKERTREFGIRKAIGAKPASILWLIIAESIIITVFFGFVGMICGIAANEYMDATLGHSPVNTGISTMTIFVNPRVGLDVCLGALLVMVVAGTMAGLVPARRAARIRPIEALRAE